MRLPSPSSIEPIRADALLHLLILQAQQPVDLSVWPICQMDSMTVRTRDNTRFQGCWELGLQTYRGNLRLNGDRSFVSSTYRG